MLGTLQDRGPSTSDTDTSDTSTHSIISSNLIWTVQNEKGYKYLGPERILIPLHSELEDFHWPNDRNTNNQCQCGAQVFILADGHGGAQAARHFVPLLASNIMTLLDSKEWELHSHTHQNELKDILCDMFKRLDVEYGNYKVEEFRKWLEAINDLKSKNLKTLQEIESELPKPDDDGCTMVVNILHQGYLINCNTGDSRTLLGGRSLSKKEWSTIYSSNDHNTTHPSKVWSIHCNGGRFLTSEGRFLNYKLQQNESHEPYTKLAGTRVYRPLNPLIETVGISHRRTINLTASMGDLLFKLDPPIISAEPDVNFIELRSDTEYILIICTDGVWDHLKIAQGKPETSRNQNALVMDHVTSILDGYADFWIDLYDSHDINDVDSHLESQDKSYNSLFAQRLDFAARNLVSREHLQMDSNMFWSKLVRYDDATAQLIHIAPFGWRVS